jgi:hypothetical protein
MVAGGGHPTVHGPLPGIRETQSNLNDGRRDWPAERVVTSAQLEGARAETT